MRPRVWVFVAVLLLAGCTERPQETKGTAPAHPAQAKTPVRGATLTGQGIDSDGDGRADRWRRVDPETGRVYEARDTDGDGVPDRTEELDVRAGPPPGVRVEGGGGSGLKPLPAEPPSEER
ncbi:MAG: hypothetical protein D6731_12705 [Planctomycetota bacterium]|nr:MAG: hypothetical protein D6731_12705 [Planctomycetota bacterium]